MKSSWYEGTTGLPPLDYAIKNALTYGWSHFMVRPLTKPVQHLTSPPITTPNIA